VQGGGENASLRGIKEAGEDAENLVVSSLPEPYASMPPTDPRRVQYEREQALDSFRVRRELAKPAPSPRPAPPKDPVQESWDAGDRVLSVTINVANTVTRLGSNGPQVGLTANLAREIEFIESVGWALDSIQYVFVPGNTAAIAPGWDLTHGAILAFTLWRRPVGHPGA